MGGTDLHAYVSADNHLPQNIKNHSMVPFKCAAQWKETSEKNTTKKKLSTCI